MLDYGLPQRVLSGKLTCILNDYAVVLLLVLLAFTQPDSTDEPIICDTVN